MTIRFSVNDITGTHQEVDRFLDPANIISYNDIILIMLDFLISILDYYYKYIFFSFHSDLLFFFFFFFIIIILIT